MYGMSCAPGTWISSVWSSPHEHSSHWYSPLEQSSHICRTASVGVSGITSLYRWGSPSHVEVFCHRKLAPGHLSHWLTWTQHTWCPLLVYGQSPPPSSVDSHSHIAAQSLWWQHRQSHVGQSAVGKCHTFCAALSERSWFLYGFWCWSSGGQPKPADGMMVADYCPLAMSPTLGTRIWLSWVLPLLCGGEACALGPWHQWTD